MHIVLDICRRATLMQPLVDRFDAIPMMTPVERVKTAATVIIEAAEEHDYLRELVKSSGCMAALQQIARERATGAVDLPQLKPDLPSPSLKLREGT